MTMRPAVEKYYSVAEAAVLLGYCTKWVLLKVKAGEFPGTFGEAKDYRIPASAINGWIAARLVKRIGAAEEPSAHEAESLGISARTKGELKRKATQRVASPNCGEKPDYKHHRYGEEM